MKNKVPVALGVIIVAGAIAIRFRGHDKTNPTRKPATTITDVEPDRKKPSTQDAQHLANPIKTRASQKLSASNESQYSTMSQGDLAALTGDERQSAVSEVISTSPEIEKVAEVHEINCEETKCTVELQSKTTNIDAEFQMAVVHLLQKNPWIGSQMNFDPSKQSDNRMLRYVFTQPKSKDADL